MYLNPYILEKSILFSGIDAKSFSSVLGCVGAQLREFEKGEYISLNSDQLCAVGLVLRGRVFMLKEDIYGNRNILSILECGELFGESFVCGGAYTLTISIQATENTEILFLSFDRIMNICSNACEFHSKLITNMVTMIAKKNMSLLEKLEITTRHSLREKILAYLSQLAQKQCSSTVTSSMGRMELADFLGVNRSALTRELNKMQDEKIIKFNKNTYTLLDINPF